MTQTTEPLRRLCQSILKANDSNDSVAATTDELLSRVAKTALNAFDESNTIHVSAGESVQAAIIKAVAGMDIVAAPGVYTGATITVPTGVNIIGSGTNCIFQFNVVLQGTADITGIYIDDGYYIERGGIKYYG